VNIFEMMMERYVVDQKNKSLSLLTSMKIFLNVSHVNTHLRLKRVTNLRLIRLKKWMTMQSRDKQWAVPLGRFDIQTTTMTMSQCRVAPRLGHLERLKRMYGYLKKFSAAAIQDKVLQPVEYESTVLKVSLYLWR
jgi:hypothetical protein